MQHSPRGSVEQGLELHRAGRLEEAEFQYRLCIEQEERAPEALHHLGNLFFQEGKKDLAAECFSALLERIPTHVSGRFLLQATRGERPDVAPAAYVRELFDAAADTFDALLVDSLHYRAPEFLREAVRRSGWDDDTRRSDRVVLDLGCGTGLSGLLFQGTRTRLMGCDLSPRMVEKSRARGVYEHIQVSDIVSFLGSCCEGADLVLAGDVLPYVGVLEPVFHACRQALRGPGLFAFTVEASSSGDCDYQLRSTGRFAHSLAYVERLAEREGFSIVRCDDVLVRRERGEPVPGLVFVLLLGEATQQRDTLDLAFTHGAAASSLLKKAINLHREGRLEEASRSYEAVLAVDPSNELARRFLDVIERCYHRGKPRETI